MKKKSKQKILKKSTKKRKSRPKLKLKSKPKIREKLRKKHASNVEILNKAHIVNVLMKFEEAKLKYYEKLKKVPLEKLEKQLSMAEFREALKYFRKGYKQKNYRNFSNDYLKRLYLKKLKETPREKLHEILPKSDYKRVLKIAKGLIKDYEMRDYKKKK